MNNLDITERSILETERDELRLENLQLRCAFEDAKHLFTILKYLPESVFVDMAHVLEYGDRKHPGEEWRKLSVLDHLEHVRDHIRLWKIGWYLKNRRLDKETGKSHLIHAAIRCLMAAAREKDND